MRYMSRSRSVRPSIESSVEFDHSLVSVQYGMDAKPKMALQTQDSPQ